MPSEVMSFEEWDKLVYPFSGKTNRDLFEAARAGMIPAANAIQIPPVEEWPDSADAVCLFYYRYEGGISKFTSAIQTIPRPTPPKPKYVPQVGDKVAAWDDGMCDFDYPMIFERPTQDNWDHYAKLESIDDIGKPISWFKANRDWI